MVAHAAFEVLRAVALNASVFCNIGSCTSADDYVASFIREENNLNKKRVLLSTCFEKLLSCYVYYRP
jgi:hypothetical protein